MKFKATHRFARIKTVKTRQVMDLIRGKPVNIALEVLRTTRRRASAMIDKVVRSAIANATENADADVDALYVAEAYVDEGPRMKRIQPRARGMWFPIIKRTSHITVVLSDGGEGEEE
jgi:large subunit ribosomal protein L22